MKILWIILPPVIVAGLYLGLIVFVAWLDSDDRKSFLRNLQQKFCFHRWGAWEKWYEGEKEVIYERLCSKCGADEKKRVPKTKKKKK